MNSSKIIRENQILVSQVMSIIDTKIQYLDYQTNQIVSSIIGTELPNVPRPNVDPKDVASFNFSHNYSDSFLTLMEEFSRTKRQLLLLRKHTSPQTADFILNLITDNQFLIFSDEELKQKIKTLDHTQQEGK